MRGRALAFSASRGVSIVQQKEVEQEDAPAASVLSAHFSAFLGLGLCQCLPFVAAVRGLGAF
jgi:hypothetical protein